MDCMRRLCYARVPEDPILTYEAYLEEYVGKQYAYLLLDKATYQSHKCDANLSDVYQQEIILRDEMLRLVRYRRGNDPLNPLYDMQIQILEKDMSRYRYLLDELNYRLSLPKVWICS
jgi:hypothetical protein